MTKQNYDKCPLTMKRIPINLLLKKEMLQTKSFIRKRHKIKAQFLAEVIFGKPSKKCVNFGICRIDPIGFAEKTCKCKYRKIQAIVSIFDEDYLELDILKTSIRQLTYEKYLSKRFFLVEEDFHFAHEGYFVCIKRGYYKIIENNTLVKVIFSSLVLNR